MNLFSIFVVIFVVLLAIFTGYIIYRTTVRSWLQSNCFLDNSCLELRVYKVENSALIYVQNYDYAIWFNGAYIFIYGQSRGEKCEDQDSEPAYQYEFPEAIPKGYNCVQKLSKVDDFYKSSSVEKTYYLNVQNKQTFGVLDVLTWLQDQGILDFGSLSKATLLRIPDENKQQ